MKESFSVIGKAPLLKLTKTRLAHDVGDKAALELYQAFIKDFIANYLNSTFSSQSIDLFLTPKTEKSKEFFLNNFDVNIFNYHFQSDLSFFERLVEIVSKDENTFVHLTGTDIPDFPFEDLLEVRPSEKICYIGPDEDGGFYYVGISSNNAHCLLIDEVDQAKGICNGLVKNCQNAGLEVIFLKPWSDIDTIFDLKKSLERSGINRLPYTYEVAREFKII